MESRWSVNPIYNHDNSSEHTAESKRKTQKLKWPIAYYYDVRKERLFYLLLHVLFLLDEVGAFIEHLIYIYVMIVLDTIYSVIISLGMAALFIVLQQLMLLLLASLLLAKVDLQLPVRIFLTVKVPFNQFPFSEVFYNNRSKRNNKITIKCVLKLSLSTKI